MGFPVDLRLPDDVRPADDIDTISEVESFVLEDILILIDVPALLDRQHVRLQDPRDLLKEDSITPSFKTHGQLSALRDLLHRHRQREIIVRLENHHGAEKTIRKFGNVLGQEDRLFARGAALGCSCRKSSNIGSMGH